MNKQVVTIKNKITKLSQQLVDIQNQCPHENIQGEYKASTGNWCQQDDSYWISGKCLDCDKSLYADSEKQPELYRKYSMSGMVK